MTSRTNIIPERLKRRMEHSFNDSIKNTMSSQRNLNNTRVANNIFNMSNVQSSDLSRIIPNRAATNFELANFLVKRGPNENSDEETHIPAKKRQFQKYIADIAQIPDRKSERILHYQTHMSKTNEMHSPAMKLFQTKKAPTRYITPTSERVLDVPNFSNNFYTNLMDWSRLNIVAIALGNQVYLWNAQHFRVELLKSYEGEAYVCSLCFIDEGQKLSIGNSVGGIELWDCSKLTQLRRMHGHDSRVSVLSWNSDILSSGGQDGKIINHDVRNPDHKSSILSGHPGSEVCGLKWSSDSKHLASGGNDCCVKVWSLAHSGVSHGTKPLHAFFEHRAPVRALAWCPWQAHILSSGGGSADRCINSWNVKTGELVKSLDTQSQVCALLFSRNHRELISAHGFDKNQLTIWKYPSMFKQIDLMGHHAPVLQLAMSPDGRTVASASADETLRLWNCFEPDLQAIKKGKSNYERGMFFPTIR